MTDEKVVYLKVNWVSAEVMYRVLSILRKKCVSSDTGVRMLNYNPDYYLLIMELGQVI